MTAMVTRSRPSQNNRTWLSFAVLILLALVLQSCSSNKNSSNKNEAGVALVDDYLKATGHSSARDVSTTTMLAALEELDGRAQTVEQQVPQEFYGRYRRLLSVTKMVITPKRDDNTTQEIREYVRDITGDTPTGGDNDLIGASANAFVIETQRLRDLLK